MSFLGRFCLTTIDTLKMLIQMFEFVQFASLIITSSLNYSRRIPLDIARLEEREFGIQHMQICSFSAEGSLAIQEISHVRNSAWLDNIIEM